MNDTERAHAAQEKAQWLAGHFCYLIFGNELLGGPMVRCGCPVAKEPTP